MPETPAQKKTVERVMHEFAHGELKGRDGKVIKNRKQAVAIGLSEAGDSNQVTPKQNRHNQAHARTNARKGRTGQQEKEGAASVTHNRSDLYAQAKERDIPGRSKMNKAQLEHALAK